MSLYETIQNLSLMSGHTLYSMRDSIRCIRCNCWLYWKYAGSSAIYLYNPVLQECGKGIICGSESYWTSEVLDELGCQLGHYGIAQVIVKQIDEPN